MVINIFHSFIPDEITPTLGLVRAKRWSMGWEDSMIDLIYRFSMEQLQMIFTLVGKWIDILGILLQ